MDFNLKHKFGYQNWIFIIKNAKKVIHCMEFCIRPWPYTI